MKLKKRKISIFVVSFNLFPKKVPNREKQRSFQPTAKTLILLGSIEEVKQTKLMKVPKFAKRCKYTKYKIFKKFKNEQFTH